MAGSGLRIARILGIPIFLHGSWFIIFALITYSLAGLFAHQHPQWSDGQHWALGILTSLLFFGSVLFHELAHSVVALRYRIPVVSITLFIFGGLARISREPGSPRQEFNIAVAGPLSSYFLGGAFYLLEWSFPEQQAVVTVAGWLGWINVMLATFNLLPGFPLDGGRMLRAVVWGITSDYGRSSRFAANSGKFFAYAMILFGGVRAFTGDIGGLWLAFVGWFLLSAAQASHTQVAIRDVLRGLTASDVMGAEVPTVGREISLEDYVQELLRTGRRCHLVVDDGHMVGMMTVHAANKVPREEWAVTSVQGAMLPAGQVLHTAPDEPVLTVLERMQSDDINQMPVVRDGRIIGLVSRDTILRIIQTRMEFSQ